MDDNKLPWPLWRTSLLYGPAVEIHPRNNSHFQIKGLCHVISHKVPTTKQFRIWLWNFQVIRLWTSIFNVARHLMRDLIPRYVPTSGFYPAVLQRPPPPLSRVGRPKGGAAPDQLKIRISQRIHNCIWNGLRLVLFFGGGVFLWRRKQTRGENLVI